MSKTSYNLGRREYKKKRGLVNECPQTLFKDPKFRKYSLKKSNVINFNALITRFFMKAYY